MKNRAKKKERQKSKVKVLFFKETKLTHKLTARFTRRKTKKTATFTIINEKGGINKNSRGIKRVVGVGNGNPLQNSCLENSMDRGAWQAKVKGVAKRKT